MHNTHKSSTKIDIVNYRNQYIPMAKFYDEAVTAGYYDYLEAAKSLNKNIKNNTKKILEIGVGTGLFIQQLIKLRPDCEFYGIDHTREMIEQAKNRLGDRATLEEKDISQMQLETKFEIAFSHGGVWVFLEDILLTHIQDDDINLKGLCNLFNHIKEGGLFIVNIQPMHSNSETLLDNNIIFKQEVKIEETICYKDYIFEKDGDILSKQRCTYRLYKGNLVENLLVKKVGFEYVGISEDQRYRIYRKPISVL